MGPGSSSDHASRSGRGWEIDQPAGWRVLVPGFPQWRWRQKERALVLFGSFAASIGVGLFAWGTPIGSAVLGFAFIAHVASAADAIRQGAFPGFGRWVPMASASAGLGLCCYAPVLAVLLMVAWPGDRQGRPVERYLVNRWAYNHVEPETGQWIWFEHPGGQGREIGRLLAGPGQAVEYFGNRLTVGGAAVEWVPPAGSTTMLDLSMTVPEGYVLVSTGMHTRTGTDRSLGLLLVDSRLVLGRAWAQNQPIWSRRFLP